MSAFTAPIPGVGWVSQSRPFYQLGEHTLRVPLSLHRINRKKLLSILSKRSPAVAPGLCLFAGGNESCHYDSDTELLFRQDSWFQYLFGVKEVGMYGCICTTTGKATLFIPRYDDEYSVWCGTVHPPEHFLKMYDVDEVIYADQMAEWIRQKLASLGQSSVIHVMHGQNSDSGSYCVPPTFNGVEEFKHLFDTTALFHATATARVVKSAEEIEVMKYVAMVGSNAHVAVMRMARAGMIEYELEAQFLYEVYKKGGCRRAAYTSICACGPNGATLHYGHAGAPNDRPLLPTDMALLDQGADYHGYVTDITCSFPISGRFTSDQAAVYNGVLNAQRAVLEMLRPGVSWTDCHRAATREILIALREVGVLNGPIDEMLEADVGAIFLPHGLGHLIGLDTHDVGGYIDGTPERSSKPGFRKLRTARVAEAGMVLTNEPGCYFIDTLLRRALADPILSKYINVEILDRFRNFGGVRIEDVIVVTETGVENITLCPRLVSEIESVMAGGQWPPARDEAPYLRRRWVKVAPGGSHMQDIELH